ncbi:MAG: long-chain fatty acid--CoA ligase [Methylocystaceae bacterium]|nr:long-chain fatty acid--CoA ligase [Methylocystaceae bacterium]
MITQTTNYSYAQLREHSDKLADLIADISTSRPRISLLCDDPFETAALSFAIARLDGVCIPVNSQMMPEQLLQGWKDTDTTIVFYDDAQKKKVAALKGKGPLFICTNDLESHHSSENNEQAWQGSDDFLITLSSGSTGAPKPIVISQTVKLKRAEQAWRMYELCADDIILCASPFFHSLGQRLVFTPLLLGATCVHIHPFTPAKWIEAVHQHKVTYTTSVSSHLYALKDQLLKQASKIKSLKTIVTSSAPIDVHFKEQFFQEVGCDFHEIYGATEIACATNLYPRFKAEKYSTVGHACENVEIRILDDNGQDVPPNSIGEIAVKSPLRFEEYYKKPELTQKSFQDGFFKTGDLGFMDKNFFLSYVSRKKDVIICGGINIYPEDIENVLSELDILKEIAVIGVKDSLLGEVIVAICVADIPCERELRKIANQQLAPFQRPLKYFFVSSLPLTPSGKLSKQALRDEYTPQNTDWTMALRALLYGK